MFIIFLSCGNRVKNNPSQYSRCLDGPQTILAIKSFTCTPGRGQEVPTIPREPLFGLETIQPFHRIPGLDWRNQAILSQGLVA